MPYAPNPCPVHLCDPLNTCHGDYYDYYNTTGIPKANSSSVCECWSGLGCTHLTAYFACNAGYHYDGLACVKNAPSISGLHGAIEVLGIYSGMYWRTTRKKRRLSQVLNTT